MSIWHKILIAFIFLTIPVNFFFACRTLKTHQVWRDKIRDLETQIASVEKEIHNLEYGVEKQDSDSTDGSAENQDEKAVKGIRDLVRELDVIMFQRGRVWFDASAMPDTATGSVILEVLSPNPHNIVKGTILYCFDASVKEEGGAYIGKFTVNEVEDTKIQIVPSMEMTMSDSGVAHPNEHLTDKLKHASETWNIYEKMPRDERAMYRSMKEEKIRELMPEGSADEFVKDGKDDPDRPGMKYERPLRDYERIFDACSSQSAKLDDLIVAAHFDMLYAQSALEDAKKLETSQENLKKQYVLQVAQVKKERDAVAAHLNVVTARSQQYSAKIKAIRAENIKLARQIDQCQREAAKRIYSRVQANTTASAM